MGVQGTVRRKSGSDADTGTAGEPRGAEHENCLARQTEDGHKAAAGIADPIHHAEDSQHVGEHERHQHVRDQVEDAEIPALAAADDKDIKRILGNFFGLSCVVITHLRSPSYKRSRARSERASRRQTSGRGKPPSEPRSGQGTRR